MEQKDQKSAKMQKKKCEKCDANAKCECDAKAVRCDAMGLDKSANANANAKNFPHYHPWLDQHAKIEVGDWVVRSKRTFHQETSINESRKNTNAKYYLLSETNALQEDTFSEEDTSGIRV
jgi:hypothetical protein